MDLTGSHDNVSEDSTNFLEHKQVVEGQAARLYVSASFYKFVHIT